MSNVQEIWHPIKNDSNQLFQAAAHACGHIKQEPHITITNFLSNRGTTSHQQPMLVLSGNPQYGVFHNGAHYEVYAVGEPEAVLHVCRMSENDREKALLESRRMGNSNAQVMAIARATTPTAPAHARDIKNLVFCGHVSVI